MIPGSIGAHRPQNRGTRYNGGAPVPSGDEPPSAAANAREP